MDDFLSSKMFVQPPLPCLDDPPIVFPVMCWPPFDVEELPADDGVLYGGGDREGKSRGSAAMYVR